MRISDWSSDVCSSDLFAVTGIGDCGSCSTNSVHDGIEIEKRGIPAVAVCTEAFLPGLDALTQMRGMPDYQFAVVPHPLGVLFDDELHQRAVLAAPQVADIVTGKSMGKKDAAEGAARSKKIGRESGRERGCQDG